jgi:hypothetical protein
MRNFSKPGIGRMSWPHWPTVSRQGVGDLNGEIEEQLQVQRAAARDRCNWSLSCNF